MEKHGASRGCLDASWADLDASQAGLDESLQTSGAFLGDRGASMANFDEARTRFGASASRASLGVQLAQHDEQRAKRVGARLEKRGVAQASQQHGPLPIAPLRFLGGCGRVAGTAVELLEVGTGVLCQKGRTCWLLL